MTVEEVNKILKDKSMSKKQTNFKVVEDKTKGSNKITLALLYKEFKEFSNYVLDVFKRNNLK